jgi:hypothetical protein
VSGQICFHPGSASDGDVAKAAQRVAKAITVALDSMESSTRILVENTAGAGKTIGRTAEEVGDILRHVPDRLRERTGYGLDTAICTLPATTLRHRRKSSRTSSMNSKNRLEKSRRSSI